MSGVDCAHPLCANRATAGAVCGLHLGRWQAWQPPKTPGACRHVTCHQPVRARGLCIAHYRQLVRLTHRPGTERRRIALAFSRTRSVLAVMSELGLDYETVHGALAA